MLWCLHARLRLHAYGLRTCKSHAATHPKWCPGIRDTALRRHTARQRSKQLAQLPLKLPTRMSTRIADKAQTVQACRLTVSAASSQHAAAQHPAAKVARFVPQRAQARAIQAGRRQFTEWLPSQGHVWESLHSGGYEAKQISGNPKAAVSLRGGCARARVCKGPRQQPAHRLA